MSTALLSAFCDLDFLHSAEPSLGSLSPGVLDARAAGSRAGGAPGPRYKTELCRPFEESGACRYGDKCQFAHGGRELRLLARHPKYKTELCRTFHSAGLCPYGPRCHFIHNADERRPRPARPAPPEPARPGPERPERLARPGPEPARPARPDPDPHPDPARPAPEPGRRLPIFSRLSVSDD